MHHEIYTVKSFKIAGPYILWIQFDDDREQVINFLPMLRGELYAPLRNLKLFNQVQLDEEAGNLIWPNDADFDPATLHNWDVVGDAMIKMAQSWPEGPEFHEPLTETAITR
jgi:hypothetical protein